MSESISLREALRQVETVFGKCYKSIYLEINDPANGDEPTIKWAIYVGNPHNTRSDTRLTIGKAIESLKEILHIDQTKTEDVVIDEREVM